MAQQEERNVLQKIFKPETSKGRIRQVLVLIILLTLGGLFIDAGKYYNQGTAWVAAKTGNVVQLPQTQAIPFNLGLDLKGGTRLVYKADISEVPPEQEESAIKGVRDVIERRVNAFGVSDPSIRTVKTKDGNYRIYANLAGIKDVNKAIKEIGRTPLLQFKEQAKNADDLSKEKRQQIEEYNKQAEKRAEEVLGKALSGGDFNALEKEYDESTTTEPRWTTSKDSPQIVKAIQDLGEGNIYNDLVETSEGYRVVKLMEKRVKTNEFTGEEKKEVKASHLLICYEGTPNCNNDLSKEEAYQRIKDIKQNATPGNFSELVKQHSTEPGASESGGSLGWIQKGDMVQPFEKAVFEQEPGTISFVVETKFGYHLIHKKDERKVQEYRIDDILIKTKDAQEVLKNSPQWKTTELTGKYLDNASLQWSRTNKPQVALQFNSEGADLFEKITERNIGNKVAIFLDGKVVSAPNVNEKIPNGKAVITGDFTVQEAKDMVMRLNEGALPVPIDLVSQKTVGPTLGEESVKNSLNAGVIGLILIALFMIVVYRLPGLISVVSLGVYGVLVLAIFKLFSVALTLPGLAGFILSIGMAVDANVLILERLKEELRQDKDTSEALKEAFRRAWPSIRDGNVSTFITCLILMFFTTSLVRGFAITLGIGVLVSLFAAMVVTRNFFNLVPITWFRKKILGIK